MFIYFLGETLETNLLVRCFYSYFLDLFYGWIIRNLSVFRWFLLFYDRKLYVCSLFYSSVVETHLFFH